jgi:hypothetical protein
MSYNIFLKSLRSLDKFRENPHIKIPPKSPCTNFQSPNIFKILFYSEMSFPSTFGPSSHLAFLALSSPPGRGPFPFLPPSLEPAALPRPPPRLPLFMADRYHSLILAIITIYILYSLPPLIPTAGRYRVPRLVAPSPGPINRSHRPRSSPHLPHLTLPLS